MKNFVSLERIDLAKDKATNEKMIQEYIFENPGVLGLNNKVISLQREKIQSSGGFVDMILADESTRYEVEIQLGATDPSHIIRTIEYWDLERRRYPHLDHVAVIVAEEITGRFMNVIQLFNGHIPLIAIQMNAYEDGDKKVLVFTKVLDRVTLGTEEEEVGLETERPYWETERSNKKILAIVDHIMETYKDTINGFELAYRKFYIGLKRNGISKKFISFTPQKKSLLFNVKGQYSEDKIADIEKEGLEVGYDSSYAQYQIRINDMEEFNKHQEYLRGLVEEAKIYYNISD